MHVGDIPGVQKIMEGAGVLVHMYTTLHKVHQITCTKLMCNYKCMLPEACITSNNNEV